MRPSEFMPMPEVRPQAEPLFTTTEDYPKQDFRKLLPKPSDQPLLIPYDINNLTAGNVLYFYCDSGVPDYWLVSIRPGTGLKISVFLGPNASGIPFRLGGGGKLKLPANSEYLALLGETGTQPASGTVIAVRQYDNVEIDPGDLA